MFQVASHSHRPGERPGQGSARRLRKETEADFSGISVPLCVILSHLALATGSECSDICLIFVALSQFPTCIYEYLHHCVHPALAAWPGLRSCRGGRTRHVSMVRPCNRSWKGASVIHNMGDSGTTGNAPRLETRLNGWRTGQPHNERGSEQWALTRLARRATSLRMSSGWPSKSMDPTSIVLPACLTL